MQLGVQYSLGELLGYEPASDLEERVKDAIEERIDAERADRGLGPVRRDASARAAARDTARWLAETDYFEAPVAAGVRPAANRSLPNRKGFCDRVPATLAVDRPGWAVGERAVASGSAVADEKAVPDAAVDHVAKRAVALLSRTGSHPLFARPNDHGHGVGVVVDGDAVYVVYRMCNPGY